ncbi:MAG: cardiolipin synthase [Lachnospiraceae bacterium]|nr:cardiolipin synthase [Lachnospiraceae bacterium]
MQDNQNTEEISLLTRGKRGILRIVFSRIGLFLVIIALQVAIYISIYHWFQSYFSWFNIAQTIFVIIMVIYLINCDMDATGKLTWLFIITLFPIAGSLFLWFTRQDPGHQTIKKRLLERINESREYLSQEEGILTDKELMASGVDDLNRYMNRSGCFPVFRDTDVTYFPLGEDMFAAMCEEMKKAEKYIFMEYFIIQEGMMWGRLLKILADKAAEGVDVRVMYDGMCDLSLLSSDYPKRMATLGIKCKSFSPITPLVSTHYNNRDHRKILVIDGKVAFNGGVNLADEYINHIKVYGHWKDTAVMLKGKAAASFTLMFLQMWNLTEKTADWSPSQLTAAEGTGEGYVIPYCDCPLDGDKVGEMVYCDILNRAKSYVHIMTPYLILDNELETAMKFAAERGVDVRLIVPGIPDKKLVYSLTRSYYRFLLEAGVKIYEYTPGFVHAKVFVSDDERAVVGTINLDYRSLYHHFECATYLYKTSCIADIEKDYQETLSKCKRVEQSGIRKGNIPGGLTGCVLKIIAPLL